MLENTSGNTVEAPRSKGVSRRQVMVAAAWSAPVIAAAVATPLAAASSTQALDLSSLAGWPVSVVGASSADVTVSGNSLINWTDASSTANAVITFTGTLSGVVAGTTYTFGIRANGGYGDHYPGSSTPSTAEVFFDGTPIISFATRKDEMPAQIQLGIWHPNNAPWIGADAPTYPVSYTATSSGTVPVQVVVTVLGQLPGRLHGDDIFIEFVN